MALDLIGLVLKVTSLKVSPLPLRNVIGICLVYLQALHAINSKGSIKPGDKQSDMCVCVGLILGTV